MHLQHARQPSYGHCHFHSTRKYQHHNNYIFEYGYFISDYDEFYEFDYEPALNLHGHEYAFRDYVEPGVYENNNDHNDYDWYRR